MAKANILTANDIDLFAARLKATVAAAARNEQTLRLLEQFRGSLGGARPTGSLLGGSAGRRARKPGIEPAKVLELLKGHKEGVAIGEMAKKLGEPRPRVGAALAKLRGSRKAKMTGTRASARWFAT